MMVTSFLNVQFEQMISTLPPKAFSLKNPPNPKEMECLGFKFSDVTLDFKKGFMQAGCGYKKVTKPSDPETCEKFLDVLRNGPSEAMKMANKFMNQQEETNDLKEIAEDLDVAEEVVEKVVTSE